MKLQKLKYKALAVFAIFTIGIGFLGANNTQRTYAEEANTNLIVSPMAQKIILVPGETYSGSITVANGSNATANLNYIAEVGPFNQIREKDSKDDYGTSDVNNKTEYNVIMDWLTLEKAKGTVEPNGNDMLNFTIKVPKDAPAGAQYASILVYRDESDSATSSGGSTNIGITSKYQLASVIFANVAGETIEKGSISENNMPSVLTNNKLEATSMVRNDGNIYTDATYTLQVWPLTSDEELCTNEEKAETSMILPNTERYHVQTCDLPAVGIFRAKQVVKIFGEESVLEKTIFVCPVWLMILAIVIVVAIITAIIIIIKKNKAKKSED